MINLEHQYRQIELEEDRNTNFQRFVRRINKILLLLLAALMVGPFLIYWLLSPQEPAIPSIEMTSLVSKGPTDLCPGDVLKSSYTYSARGSGIITIDYTIFRITPPATIIPSQPRRIILEGPFTREVFDAWVVPETFYDEASGSFSNLDPGRYKRYISMSSPHFDSLFSFSSLDFTIREDCK